MEFAFGLSPVIIIQLVVAVFLGALIGLEREYQGKEAGLRTYSLVSLGSALFTIISFQMLSSGDPTRVIQAVATGIGFIGAGLIIRRQFRVEGLTTAAGLWVTAAVGVAVGSGLYFPAVFVAFITIGILAGLRLIEERILGSKMPGQ